MHSQVIAADGHTYERAYIEDWLATGKMTSPKTNATLPNTGLVPNQAIKTLCLEFRAKHAAKAK